MLFVFLYNIKCMGIGKRRAQYFSINYDEKITGTIKFIGSRHLEVSIPNESKIGYCKLSNTSDFSKNNFKNYFKVGDELVFIVNKKQSSNNKISLNYKLVHPEEMKSKPKPIGTISYHKNLNVYIKKLVTKYKFSNDSTKTFRTRKEF